MSGPDIDAVVAYTADEVRAAERPLLAAGVPLMQRAAAGLADAVSAELDRRGVAPGRVLALAGAGDNGGDALFAAALLAERGAAVTVALTGRRAHEGGLAAAVAAGARVLAADVGPDVVVAVAEAADLVLDGVLGIGARGPLRPPAADVVRALQQLAGRPGAPLVLAVDLPSGVDADTGEAPDPVLRADATVTFGAVKRGLLLEPARSIAGRVQLVDIGLGLPSGRRPTDSGDRGRAALGQEPGTAQQTMGR